MRRPAIDSRVRGSGGSTLGELLVAVTVFGVVLAMALPFMHAQNLGFRRSLDRMFTVQALRRAATVLERDLPTAGTHLAQGQPAIVYADEDILAFNADYASRDPSDALAVFFDSQLSANSTEVLPESHKQPLGHSSFVYPSRTYRDDSGEPGSAETLVFFFSPDPETPREDDYALFRQVNSDPPRRVADGIVRLGERPFFRYLRATPQGVDSIPDSLLPAAHLAQVHGSPEDTGSAALVDQIRAVRIALAVTNGRNGKDEQTAHVSRVVQLPNAVTVTHTICGGPPALGPRVKAKPGHAPTGEPLLTLSWEPARDEVDGDEDIVRYLVWKREAGTGVWMEPYLSLPAGKETYSYTDRSVRPGARYQYAVAAQDCSQGVSPRIVSPVLTAPRSLELTALEQEDGQGSSRDRTGPGPASPQAGR